MAAANPVSDLTTTTARPGAGLLVQLACMPPEQLDSVLASVTSIFPADGLIIATPDAPSAGRYPSLKVVPAAPTNAAWTLTAADFVNAYQLAKQHDARAILLLGPEAATLSPTALLEISTAVLATPADLAIPCYDLPPRAGLVNSAILYPLTRALFAAKARFPLAIDLGLSLRMAQRLAAVAQRCTAMNQNDALIWPVDEAAAAGFTVHEVDTGTRTLPQPGQHDLNAMLALVAGSLFADIDAKAAFWQRARPLPPGRIPISSDPSPIPADVSGDIAPMLDAFQLAYTNLQEIWSIVLPPNSLLGLKRLSATSAAAFRMPDSLWARIVYDFLLAYRLRTINRGHLLGALTPLYLAWVASHINITASGTNAERHIEAVATAFETDKPYLVSRWRWPDRFNP
jgi:hypothetical protein